MIPPSKIPWWLAQVAYVRMVNLYGKIKPLEKIAEEGGFEVDVFLDFLAGGTGDGKAFRTAIAKKEKSIKNDLEIIVAGTKPYRDYLKWLDDQRKQKTEKLIFGAAGSFVRNGRR